MKNSLKIFLILLGSIILLVAVMAVLDFCPPQGPWPMPPWCPGDEVSLPVSEPESEPESEEETVPVAEITENEILARVAIGLVQDLTTVNTYFNDATNSIGEVQASVGAGNALAENLSVGKIASLAIQLRGGIPEGFLGPLPDSGFIPAPPGACAVGASPSASFLNEAGDKITPDLLDDKGIQVISFEDLTGGDIQGKQLENTITSLITPNDMDLATPEGWNTKVWDVIAENQQSAESLMDYHLWSVSDQIEEVIVESMRARMESMGLPAQVLNAFDNSDKSGWFAGPTPTEMDRLAGMEIEAIFSGKTEGTIYERRDFSLQRLGEMPQFGPMSGEGSVVYHDPDYGDYPFELDIEWTEWDELGRVTAGEIEFDDQEHGVLIEMEVRSDGSRTALVYRNGELVGQVDVDTTGMITYQDLADQ